jgi:hypothetical protein
MHRPELIMSTEWPDVGTQEWYPSPKDVWCIRLHWPVQHLPPAMGYLPTAKPLSEDPSGQLYLEVNLDFLADELALFAADPSPDGRYANATLSYPELAHSIEQADESAPLPPALRVFRDAPPAPIHEAAATTSVRRYPGFLRIVEHIVYASPDPAPGTDNLPF